MRKILILVLLASLLFFHCQKQKEDLYTIGIFQVNDAPTLNEVRRGLIRALGDNGLEDGVNVRLRIKNA